MRRLTTPTHKFRLKNIDPDITDKIKITYSQGGEVILEKYDKDGTFDGDTVTLKLTQEETANFTANKIVEIQVRAYTFGKESVASKIFSVGVLRVLDDEVLQ